MKKTRRPIIILHQPRARSARRQASIWKIVYADFMTAMMAFFLVMWVLSLSPREELKTIADYFRMPLLEAIRGGQNMDQARSIIPGGAPSVIPHDYPLPAEQRAGYQRDRERLQDMQQAQIGRASCRERGDRAAGHGGVPERTDGDRRI